MPCECRDSPSYYGSWWTPDAVSVAGNPPVDTHVLTDAYRGHTKVHVANVNGKPGWVDETLVHRMDCEAVGTGVPVRWCARCSSPFRVTSDLIACAHCGELWIAVEFFASMSGWEADDETGWSVRKVTRPITVDVLREILAARKAGDLIRELRLRLEFWELPKRLDAYHPLLYVTEPLVDCHVGQWGTVADLIARPFNGYAGERKLVTRSNSTSRWRIVSRPINKMVALGTLTLVSTWDDNVERTLAVVGDAAHRVPDKSIDKQIIEQIRGKMRAR